MKDLVSFISEKLQIKKTDKIKEKILNPEEIEGPETPAIDYNGEPCIIIGKAFKNKEDKNYKETRDLLFNKYHKNPITYDFEDIEEKDMFDWFVYAKQPKWKEIGCFAYDPSGVQAIEEK